MATTHAQQLGRLPVLRPLCLVLKAMLNERNLRDVINGGLSSWSLCNMIIAHLQEVRLAVLHSA